eukprot:SAG11_NODE_189_length_13028_cov_14.222446_5_plen_165_part_00
MECLVTCRVVLHRAVASCSPRTVRQCLVKCSVVLRRAVASCSPRMVSARVHSELFVVDVELFGTGPWRVVRHGRLGSACLRAELSCTGLGELFATDGMARLHSEFFAVEGLAGGRGELFSVLAGSVSKEETARSIYLVGGSVSSEIARACVHLGAVCTEGRYVR